MLWSNYGDVTQPGYLWWELLFSPNSRSLGVTSLVDIPYDTNNILEIFEHGWYANLSWGSDLTQDINFTPWIHDNILKVSLFNNALNQHVWQIWYDFNKSQQVDICSLSDGCNNPSGKTQIWVTPIDLEILALQEDEGVLLQDIYGKNIFEIQQWGIFKKYPSSDIRIWEEQENGVRFEVWYQNELVAYIDIDYKEPLLYASRDYSLHKNKFDTLGESIWILLTNSRYQTKQFWKGDYSTIWIWYKDPFSFWNNISPIARKFQDGYENFEKKWGLGWHDGNTTLLSFAAGESVGEATQDFMSVMSINLWDPFVFLKQSQQRSFDRTIWKQVGTRDDVQSYHVFDYNSDDLDDILTLNEDNTLDIFENHPQSTSFIHHGLLAYITDISDNLKVGNFFWDGYDDIFFVSQEWKPFVLSNTQKDFNRIDLSDTFNLNGRIIQVEVFDMDDDSYDDIVTLDDAWVIAIFYGSSTGIFQKTIVTADYGTTLDTWVRNDEGVVYHSWLPDISRDETNIELLQSNEAYLDELENNFENISSLENTTNTSLVNRLIFIELPYQIGNEPQSIAQEWFENIIEVPTSWEIADSVSDSVDALNEFIDSTGDEVQISWTNRVPQTTFIRSEYAESVWVEVEKRFRDINGGFLQSWDEVSVSIQLKNATSSSLRDFVYGEKVSDYLEYIPWSLVISQWANKVASVPWYQFMIEDLRLFPDEIISLDYKAVVRPIEYGHIQLGYFEGGTLWDDSYGDILVKQDYTNCSQVQDFYASDTRRTYISDTSSPSCNPDAHVLPESVAQNTVDSDGDGIPDYIQELTASDSVSVVWEAAEISPAVQSVVDNYYNSLSTDSDRDGIPDDEDKFHQPSGWVLGGLDSINDRVRWIISMNW